MACNVYLNIMDYKQDNYQYATFQQNANGINQAAQGIYSTNPQGALPGF